jgi:hypothetical protein
MESSTVLIQPGEHTNLMPHAYSRCLSKQL